MGDEPAPDLDPHDRDNMVKDMLARSEDVLQNGSYLDVLDMVLFAEMSNKAVSSQKRKDIYCRLL